MIRSKIEELPIKEWILPGLVGIALIPIMWLASSHLLNLVLGSPDTPTGQIGELGAVLLTGAVAMVLMSVLIVAVGEIDLRVRRNA